MSTSGTFSFTVSANDIIRESMLNIGKLGSSDTITATEYADILRKLNMIVKQLQGNTDFSKGIKTWTRRQGFLFLSNKTGQYSIGPSGDNWTNSFVSTTLMYNALKLATAITVNSSTGISINDSIGIEQSDGSMFWTTVSSIIGNSITLSTALPDSSGTGSQVFVYTKKAQQPLNVEFVLLRDTANQDIPLRILNLEEWALLPSKVDPNNQSDPTAVYVENQLTNSILRTDCGSAADTTKYIVLGYLEPIQDISGVPSENLEYPQEYFRALSWLLSREICPMFLGVWTPLMEELSKESVAIATNKNTKTSTLYFRCEEDE